MDFSSRAQRAGRAGADVWACLFPHTLGAAGHPGDSRPDKAEVKLNGIQLISREKTVFSSPGLDSSSMASLPHHPSNHMVLYTPLFLMRLFQTGCYDP